MPPITTPPAVNLPPVISAVHSTRTRVEAGDEAEVVVDVADAETPTDQLSFEWTTRPAGGTFIGTGARVIWRAPSGATSPGTYAFHVVVTERYTSQGQSRVNTAEGDLPGLHYNDSVAEVRAMAVQFYNDFSTYTVSAEQCVRNFSDTCSGKRAERRDIQDNRDRQDLRIVSGALLGSPVVGIGSGATTGRFTQRCRFEDVETPGTRRWRVEGDCVLDVIYADWRWWLCASSFENGVRTGPFGAPLNGSFTEPPRGLSVPGRPR